MMNALNYLPLPLVKALAFFREELSEERPGRVPQTMQLWVGCLLVVLISMTFEIPFLALSLAVLFYGIQSNAFYTKFVAILFVVATAMEIGSLFLIYKWSYSYPLVRLIVAGVILLGCMFMMRAHRLGLVFFAVAIVSIYGQSFPGMLDYPEVVVRLTQSAEPLPEKRIEQEALALQKLNVFCMADDADWRARSAWWQTCVTTVTYLYATLNRYDAAAFAKNQAIAPLRQKLQSEIAALQNAISNGETWHSEWQLSAEETAAARECGLENACQILRQLGQMDPDTPPAPATKPPSMAPDELYSLRPENAAGVHDLLRLLFRRRLGRDSHLHADLHHRR